MLSDHDRRTLAEIERHLQEDPALRRTLGRSREQPGAAGATSGVRRVWYALLAMSLVLTVGMVALDVAGAAFESAAVAVVVGMALRFTAKKSEPRAGRGSGPDRRP
jgi:hypothetical protein